MTVEDATFAEPRRLARSDGTATWGRFEMPDSGSPQGWRTAQEFGISAIRRPEGSP
jgi:hypothetical protein